MNKFDTWYKQYLTPKIVNLVEQTFGKNNIRKEHDPHFTKWEGRIWSSGITKKIGGDHFTYSEKELIVKHALRNIAGYDKE